MKLIAIRMNHISLLHEKTLDPSKGGIGRRLNKAKNMFTLEAKKKALYSPSFIEKIKPKGIKKRDKAMFTTGPNAATIPNSSFLSLSNINTAPGRAIINPNMLEINANINPFGNRMKRALAPKFMAKYL